MHYHCLILGMVFYPVTKTSYSNPFPGRFRPPLMNTTKPKRLSSRVTGAQRIRLLRRLSQNLSTTRAFLPVLRLVLFVEVHGFVLMFSLTGRVHLSGAALPETLLLGPEYTRIAHREHRRGGLLVGRAAGPAAATQFLLDQAGGACVLLGLGGGAAAGVGADLFHLGLEVGESGVAACGPGLQAREETGDGARGNVPQSSDAVDLEDLALRVEDGLDEAGVDGGYDEVLELASGL